MIFPLIWHPVVFVASSGIKSESFETMILIMHYFANLFFCSWKNITIVNPVTSHALHVRDLVHTTAPTAMDSSSWPPVDAVCLAVGTGMQKRKKPRQSKRSAVTVHSPGVY